MHNPRGRSGGKYTIVQISQSTICLEPSVAYKCKCITDIIVHTGLSYCLYHTQHHWSFPVHCMHVVSPDGFTSCIVILHSYRIWKLGPKMAGGMPTFSIDRYAMWGEHWEIEYWMLFCRLVTDGTAGIKVYRYVTETMVSCRVAWGHSNKSNCDLYCALFTAGGSFTQTGSQK